MHTMPNAIVSHSLFRDASARDRHQARAWILILRAAALSATLALSGCGAIDAAVDCNSICSRYADCYNANYDVGACNSRCQGNAAHSTSFSDTAGECNACINDRACTTATVDCSSQCGSIVP